MPVRKIAKGSAKKRPKPDVKKTAGRSSESRKKAPSYNAVEPSRDDILRSMLRAKHRELLKEAQSEVSKYIKGENRQMVETALDDGDWSVIDVAEDINLRQLSAHRDTIIKIEEALRKLDEQTYGVCEECEEEINPERLRILPFAIYCRDCQEDREQMEATAREDIIF